MDARSKTDRHARNKRISQNSKVQFEVFSHQILRVELMIVLVLIDYHGFHLASAFFIVFVVCDVHVSISE